MKKIDNWQNIREQVLKRDENCCRMCRTSENLHVHHIHQKYFGGSHQLSNLITLCEKCHSVRHIELQISLTRRSFEFIIYNFRRLISANRKPIYNYYPLLRLITGHSKFRDGQKEVIDEIINGNNVLVIKPTGSGKSLLYQLPSLLSKEPSIVICPLKALMKDQVEKLWSRGIPATFINSDISKEEKEERIRFFQNNAFKLMYLAPERFDTNLILDKDEIKKLVQVNIKYLIIDEAHNIEDWGHSFRENYRKIGEIKRLYNNPQIIALTATATQEVREEIINSLNITNPKTIIQGLDRPNIVIHISNVDNRNPRKEFDDKIKNILSLLQQIDKSKKTIIYVPTIRIGTNLCQRLRDNDINAEFYYSNLDSKDKAFIQNRFSGLAEPNLNLLVSTNAFGMGVDIPNIRYVVHWTQPKSLNSYYQELGRAGRDNNPSLAILLKVNNDESLIDFMIKKSLESSNLSPEQQSIRYETEKRELDRIRNFVSHGNCLRKYIHDYFDTDYTSPNNSFFSRLWYILFNMKQKDIKYCCTNCNNLHKPRKLKKVIKLVNKY